MRYIRYAFLATVAVVLISVALANRDMVTLNLLPAPLAQLTGWEYAISLPLFIVIFGGIIVGLLLGFVWEWMREYKLRAAASRTERELKQTQREMRRLKGREGKDQDEVLALLE
ncbi:LapA family protein [Cognatishimia sp. SS12]|uniref:LapA family protein n=1 Tax=Cognatishimia sp. SS12 TaxID=2979465 RepID=UPI00232C4F15|nr:LapA family protein [Cognatishimia sp. SS12]MDC0738738.1 LapA family protein [Cognatishimia sp. SS12]